MKRLPPEALARKQQVLAEREAKVQADFQEAVNNSPTVREKDSIISSLQNEVARLNSLLASKESEIMQFKNTISNLQGNTQALAVLKAENTSLKRELAEVKADKADLREDKQRAYADLTESKTQNTQLKAQVDQLEKQLFELSMMEEINQNSASADPHSVIIGNHTIESQILDQESSSVSLLGNENE